MKHLVKLHYYLAFVAPWPGPMLARWLDRGMAVLKLGEVSI